MNIREALADINPELMFMDPERFDMAIVGYIERFGQEPVVCYNKDKVLEILMENGMDWEEADEYYQFNILGAYVGEQTPVFLEVI
jgi:hypothetical protein